MPDTDTTRRRELIAAIDHAARLDTTGWTDGTGSRRPVFGKPAAIVRDLLHAKNSAIRAAGHPRWATELLEAAATAYAADNRTALRDAIRNTAALAVAWLATLDTDTVDAARDGGA